MRAEKNCCRESMISRPVQELLVWVFLARSTVMAGFTNISACVFDAYGTLFDIHAPTARIAEELGGVAQPLSDLWRLKQLHRRGRPL